MSTKKIIISLDVVKISDKLSLNAIHGVKHFSPIDRFYIEENGYIEKIKSVNKIEFLLYNLENINPTYTIQLLLCLPELWEKINYRDLLNLLENFTNSFSFYSFIGFTYKYLNINLFNDIFDNENIDNKYKKDCLLYFANTLATLYMDESDYLEFNENLLGVSLESWNNVKQRLYLESKIKKSIPIDDLYTTLLQWK